jgi:hypothetical protein
MMQTLRSDYPQQTADVSDPEILNRIRTGIIKAQSYGFEQESSALAFVTILFVVGPSFYEHPVIALHLNDVKVPPDIRMQVLANCISDEVWREAAVLTSSDARRATDNG